MNEKTNDGASLTRVGATVNARLGQLFQFCRERRCLLFPEIRVSPPAQRRSIRTLRPSLQPKSASARVNAERRGFHQGSVSSYGMSTPMRRIRAVAAFLGRKQDRVTFEGPPLQAPGRSPGLFNRFLWERPAFFSICT